MRAGQNGKSPTKELAAHLDTAAFEPAEGDSPEMVALLQTYVRLQTILEEPDPAFGRQLQGSIQGAGNQCDCRAHRQGF